MSQNWVDVGEVPVHVNDGHRQRDSVRLESIHESLVLVGAVGVVARPPVAQGPSRNNRLRSGDAVEIGGCSSVVMAVEEEIDILATGISWVVPTYRLRPSGGSIILQCE